MYIILLSMFVLLYSAALTAHDALKSIIIIIIKIIIIIIKIPKYMHINNLCLSKYFLTSCGCQPCLW